MNGCLPIRYSRGPARAAAHGQRLFLSTLPRPTPPPWRRRTCRLLTTTGRVLQRSSDPRIRDLGRQISDDYAALREHYATPKYPIVLAHGLLGFSELRISPFLPPIQYWRGIQDALAANGATVITASVPPSSSIEDRAAKLAEHIAASSSSHCRGDGGGGASTPVNIIAHSMGGLDARYMISQLLPSQSTTAAASRLRVASLVTVATPHRGSPFADYLIEDGAGPLHLPRLYGAIQRAGLGTAAFGQLTTSYMAEEFNPRVADDPTVRYFSYGAAITDEPSLLVPFWLPHRVIDRAEGANDGLVSVESSRWGMYKGTLMGVSHLDLINWSNRARWTVREWMGVKRTFNAVAFYLDIADMLAKENL